jgi:hypothetical protein
MKDNLSLIFLFILSWAFFPIGLFKSGLTRTGYSLGGFASPRLRTIGTLLAVLTAVLSFAFIADVEGRNFDLGTYFERTLDDGAIGTPFEQYLLFFPWVIEKTSQFFVPTWQIFALVGGTIALYVAFFEIRVSIHRAIHRYREKHYVRMSKIYTRLKEQHSGELTEEEDDALLSKASKAAGKHAGKWKKKHAPLSGPWETGSLIRTLKMKFDLFEIFCVFETLFTPMITVAYTIIFFIPILLVVGFWLVAIVAMLIAFAPFAWLYGNGVRMRLH